MIRFDITAQERAMITSSLLHTITKIHDTRDAVTDEETRRTLQGTAEQYQELYGKLAAPPA